MKEKDKKAMYNGFCIINGYSKWEARNYEKEIKDTFAFAFYELKYSLVNLALAFFEVFVEAYEKQQEIKREMEGEFT